MVSHRPVTGGSGPAFSGSFPAIERLLGLDIARFVAFLGMVLVNFKLAANVQPGGQDPDWLWTFYNALEGRAAALFVILAGIGLGLAVQNGLAKGRTHHQIRLSIAKRGGVLFVFGLVNLLIFEADILHYYGVYFILASLLLWGGKKTHLALAFTLIAASPILLVILDYSAGWNWENLHYSDFWTLNGFVRNLFFNGFHPVAPWLAFLLIGMALAQLNLQSATARLRILAAGVALWFAAGLFAQMGQDILQLPQVAQDKDLAEIIEALSAIAPMPPSPVYMISASGSALVALPLCLWLGDWFGKARWMQPFQAAGQQALTLYIVHIVVGMGVMEALGWVRQPGKTAMLAPDLGQITLYAAIFLTLCGLYAMLWKKWFGTGPLERLLRWLAR